MKTIKLNQKMFKYGSTKLHKYGHTNKFTVSKNPFTKSNDEYDEYIGLNGDVLFRKRYVKHGNPWYSTEVQNYNFDRDMKQNPDTRPINPGFGQEAK